MTLVGTAYHNTLAQTTEPLNRHALQPATARQTGTPSQPAVPSPALPPRPSTPPPVPANSQLLAGPGALPKAVGGAVAIALSAFVEGAGVAVLLVLESEGAGVARGGGGLCHADIVLEHHAVLAAGALEGCTGREREDSRGGTVRQDRGEGEPVGGASGVPSAWCARKHWHPSPPFLESVVCHPTRRPPTHSLVSTSMQLPAEVAVKGAVRVTPSVVASVLSAARVMHWLSWNCTLMKMAFCGKKRGGVEHVFSLLGCRVSSCSSDASGSVMLAAAAAAVGTHAPTHLRHQDVG